MSEEIEAETQEVNAKEAYTPGTLYIMQETDYLTGEKFDYYKIGIVRGEKDVATREKEHSTGNPRQITSIRDIVTPGVQKLETRLHNEYAKQRVSSGEWFHLPGTLITEAIALAEQLSAELEAEIDTLNEAKALAGPGENPALKPDAHIQALSSQLSEVLGKVAFASDYKKAVESRLKELAEGKQEWAHLFEIRSNKERSAFNTALLKKNYKALYDQYQRISYTSVTSKFTVPAYEYEAQDLYAELELINPDSLGDDVIALHQANLDHWAVDSRLKWEKEMLEAKLLTLAKDSQGIENVLEWSIRDSLKFDKAAFEQEHPEEFAASFKVTPASTTWRVAEWASYPS